MSDVMTAPRLKALNEFLKNTLSNFCCAVPISRSVIVLDISLIEAKSVAIEITIKIAL